MPDKNTFLMKPVKTLLSKYNFNNWADPFAGYNSPAEITNDINLERPTKYHEDSLKFLERFQPNTIDGVLFDPPYSIHQAVICYNGNEMSKSSALHYDQISKIIKPGGTCICFGWNSNGIGKTRGFQMEKILLLAHGSSHNDTIVTVERKINHSLI